MKREKPNVAEQFMIERIQEFPTLYKHAMNVIVSCVLERTGSCEWNEDGILVHLDKGYNTETKEWGEYPKQISEEVAHDMLNDHHGKFIRMPHSYYGSPPICNIPFNCHPDWLRAIDMFLFNFEKYTTEDIVFLARMKTFLYYGIYENINAAEPGRTIDNYNLFMKHLPSWKAKIKEIEYFQRNGKVDPETYTGMYI
jgi:hypothetical protein